MKWTEEDCATAMACGEEGIYQCEVVDIDDSKTTKAGDEMWKIEFRDCKSGETICFDRLVFNEKARGIAFTKLKALGVKKHPKTGYDVEPQELIGLSVKLSLKIDEWNGQNKLTPDIYANEPFQCGYEPIDIPF